ncbi:MAG: hypothetical protein SPL96_11120 [Bacteroidales bacterium]|nr:hypothetical protein [Bacteroidales bacterium]
MIDLKGLMIMSLLVGVAAIAVVVAIMLDLASGLRKAKLMGEARRSYAYERTTTKLMRNGSLVLIMAMIDVLLYFGHLWDILGLGILSNVPVVTFGASVWMCFVQAVSIKEKAEDKAERKTAEALKQLGEVLTTEQLQALLNKVQDKSSGNDV